MEWGTLLFKIGSKARDNILVEKKWLTILGWKNR